MNIEFFLRRKMVFLLHPPVFFVPPRPYILFGRVVQQMCPKVWCVKKVAKNTWGAPPKNRGSLGSPKKPT